jgi:hypothetical protein
VRAGERDKLITFVRPVTSEDDYGGEVEAAPTTITRAFARVRFGTGQERREAAQAAASQAATFECLLTPTLAGVLMTDRILFDDATWDITSRAPISRSEIHFTGVRQA